MTHFRKHFDAAYIGSWDLPDKDLVLVIRECKGEELTSVGGRKNRKPVIYFNGTEKGMALNKTNAKVIAAMYGVHVEEWNGKRVALYKSVTRAPDGSGDVDCIRIRPQVPKGKKEAEQPEPQPGDSVSDAPL